MVTINNVTRKFFNINRTTKLTLVLGRGPGGVNSKVRIGSVTGHSVAVQTRKVGAVTCKLLWWQWRCVVRARTHAGAINDALPP